MKGPQVARTHPGMFVTVLAMMAMHLGTAADMLLPGSDTRHSVGIWIAFKSIASVHGWGMTHLGLFLGHATALMRDTHAGRMAMRVSALLMWALTGVYLYSAIASTAASYAGAAMALALSIIATRAAVGPWSVLPAGDVTHLLTELDRRKESLL